MSSSPSAAPWQLAPLTTSGRIAAVTLLAVAVDSLVGWRVAPTAAVALAIAATTVALAIRVIRGFPFAVQRAGVVFGIVLSLATVALVSHGHRSTGRPVAALVAAVALSASGLAAVALDLLRARRANPTVIALTRSSEHAIVAARHR